MAEAVHAPVFRHQDQHDLFDILAPTIRDQAGADAVVCCCPGVRSAAWWVARVRNYSHPLLEFKVFHLRVVYVKRLGVSGRFASPDRRHDLQFIDQDLKRFLR